MATIIVDTTLDENDGSIVDGDVSLRDPLALANSGDTITFAAGPGAAFETGGTIRLAQALGELVLSTDVTIDGDIDGDGAPDVTITGARRGHPSDETHNQIGAGKSARLAALGGRSLDEIVSIIISCIA